jgi:hypothetical protein
MERYNPDSYFKEKELNSPEIIIYMVDRTKSFALVLVITLSALLLYGTSFVSAQDSPINNQNMNLGNATSSIQRNTTVENTTIDQAFDSLRDTFGSLFKK